jgi:hypothetical protein
MLIDSAYVYKYFLLLIKPGFELNSSLSNPGWVKFKQNPLNI